MRRATAVLAVAGVLASGGTAGATEPDVLVAASPGWGGEEARIAGLGEGLAVFALPTPRGTTARALAAELRRDPDVLAAQPDAKLRPAALPPGACSTTSPTETYTKVADETGASQVDVPATRPIAVLDTGVDGATPELANRLVQPFNALDGSPNAGDGDGHGTQVAGIAAAAPGKMRGVSPTSPVMPVKIFSTNGDGTAADLIKGIDTATTRGAGVINISGAGPQADADPNDVSVVSAAITAATARGAVVVAASGNDGTTDPYVPGSLPHVLTAGASQEAGRAYFSNNGPWVDVLAPGVDALAPLGPDLCATGFGPVTGTSFAAPAVAGAAAIVQQLHPEASAAQVADVVRLAAKRPAGTGRDDERGWGLLDVAAASRTPVPLTDGPEVDDDVAWLKGQYAKRHPALLRTARKQKRSAVVSSIKDPQDVWPVFVRKNQRVKVTAAGGPGALLDLSVWDPGTGAFDIGKDRRRHLLAELGSFYARPSLKFRANRTGVHYIAIVAPDPPVPSIDPGVDPETEEKAHAADAYVLTVERLRAPARRAAKAKRRGRTTR